MNIKYIALALVVLSGTAFAQETDNKEAPASDVYQFSVDQDILNLEFEGDRAVHISSASGRKEDVNKTPYQAYVIMREEIENTGALTIPEALRLAPGLLVRQNTNGIYEVHVAGTDNIPAQNELYQQKSDMVLVMIDNMPVNDYFEGGVFWETLPVSIGDIEKIEIIFGPSSVLRGRDATNGFINIITKHPDTNRLNVTANIQGGTSQTLVNNAALSFGVKDKVLVRLSGKYISTRRFQDEFYVTNENRYIQADSLLFYQSNVEETNQYGSLARQDMGLNVFVQYSPNDKTDVKVSFSTQDSESQSIHYHFDQLAYTRRSSTSQLINLNSRISNLHLQASYVLGEQNQAVGYPGYSFELSKLNTSLYYNFQIKKFSVSPGVRYQSAGFDDSKHLSADDTYPNIINGSKSIANYGGFLKVNAPLLDDKLVVDGGVSYDIYQETDQAVINYQIATAYTPLKRVLVRLSYAKGNQGEFASNALNESLVTNADNISVNNIINNELKLSEASSYSIGTRINATDKITVGLDYFRMANINPIIGLTTTTNNPDSLIHQKVNTTTELQRSGLVGNITAKISGKLKIHAFATIQSTNYENDTTSLNQDLSPKYIGGMTVNYKALLDKLNIGVSLYTFGEHAMVTSLGSQTIAAKMIPSIKVSYKIWEENVLFINARNFINNESKEYIFSDDVPGMYLIGVNINF